MNPTIEEVGAGGSAQAHLASHYFVRAGYLIDGRGGPIKKDRMIEVGQGDIVSVTPYRSKKTASRNFIDLSHCTVLPALMDAHVHLTFSGTLDVTDRQKQLHQCESDARTAIGKHCRDHLHNGIIAVRDAGDCNGAVSAAKTGQQLPIHVAATCWAWHASGRYGRMIGQTPADHADLAREVAQGPKNIDHVKIVNSGINSLDSYGHQTATQFSDDQMTRVCQWAHQKNLPVMVHANGEEAVSMSIAAGCDSIEHGYFMGLDNLRRMADTETMWVPTIIPMAALADGGTVRQKQAVVARKTLDHQMDQTARAHQLGVRIALGTDSGSLGVDHGVAVRRELSLLMDAGLPLVQAVCSATLNTARLMRLEKQGALQAGWRADWLAVRGEPKQLPGTLCRIDALCLAGQWLRTLGQRKEASGNSDRS